MSDRLTIALDAMGGDSAPDSVIEGAALASQRYPEAEFLVFGDEQRINSLMGKRKSLQQAVTICHAPEVIREDTSLLQALRKTRLSSMRLAFNAVTEGRARVVVSAGHTGILMAMAKQTLKLLPGIRRPALASFVPTRQGQAVMLDLGANVECDADDLVQFAVMGAMFSRAVLADRATDDPTVGLLNVGVEEGKGRVLIKAAADKLRKMSLPLRFKGFVEGHDIAEGVVDVIVTDGFTGNIALKTAEGTARLYSEFLRRAFHGSLLARASYHLVRSAFRKFKHRTDPRHYNGAMLLGLEGICIKSHGNSDAVGFAQALELAIMAIRNSFDERIKQQMGKLQLSLAYAPAVLAG